MLNSRFASRALFLFVLVFLGAFTSVAYADTLIFATIPGLGANVPVQKFVGTTPPIGYSSFTLTMAGTQEITDNLNTMQACTGSCIIGTSYVDLYDGNAGALTFVYEYVYSNALLKQVQASAFCSGCVDATFEYMSVTYSTTQTQPTPGSTPTPAPEPSSFLLLGWTLLGCGTVLKTRQALNQ